MLLQHLQDAPADVLQSIAGVALAILADNRKAVPDALLQIAALLHDTALLVSPLLSRFEIGSCWPDARTHIPAS